MANKKSGGGVARSVKKPEPEKLTREAGILVSALENLIQSLDLTYVHVGQVQRNILAADECGAGECDGQRLAVMYRHLAHVPALLDRIGRDAHERIQVARVRGRVQPTTTRSKSKDRGR